MDWGKMVTYLGSTTLKERTVNFGIKDNDRLRHVCVLGKFGSGRAELVVQMALQDIERGVGTVLLDASGKAAPLLIERIDPALEEQIIYLDPAQAEYPYSWNPLDDIRALPKSVQVEYLVELLLSLYHIERSGFVEYAAHLLIEKPDTSLITFHMLVTDEPSREKFFDKDEKAKEAFEQELKSDTAVKGVLEEGGRYVAKDTLVRNLLGQHESKFTLSDVVKGKILIIDFSHIRIFPTRMTPLVRVFADVMRMLGAHADTPSALYLQDTLRYLAEPEIERLFSSKKVAVTVADTIQQETDRPLREFAISRCGSIASFSTHSSDKDIVERAFYPYADSDELVRLGTGEMIVALTIDDVRARPFFAKALPLPDRKHISYQDLLVNARKKYTTARGEIDARFKRLKGDGKDNAPPERRRTPGGFQDAFRSIMANRAQQLPGKGAETKNGAEGDEKSPASGKGTSNEKNEKKKGNDDDGNGTPQGRGGNAAAPRSEPPVQNEVPEDVLKNLLYVHPIAT